MLEHSTHSTLRERVVEHVFVGEALRLLWKRKIYDVELLRSEFDAFGYDLVMVRGEVIRHIQFKTGTSRRPPDVSVACILGTKLSGCVIWIGVSSELDLKSFYWFGDEPTKRLPDILGYEQPRRATHNKAGERPLRVNHRLVPKEEFEEVGGMDALLERLLGPLDSAGS